MGKGEIIVCSLLATGRLKHFGKQGLSALCGPFVSQCCQALSLKLYLIETRE